MGNILYEVLGYRKGALVVRVVRRNWQNALKARADLRKMGMTVEGPQRVKR